MEKSNKYIRVKDVDFNEVEYFTHKTDIILKVNFDDSKFYKNLETICDCLDAPEFTNIDEKIEWVLNKIVSFVFDWIYIYAVADFSSDYSLNGYLNEKLNNTSYLVSVKEDNVNEQPIHVLHYTDYEISKKKISMYELASIEDIDHIISRDYARSKKIKN